MHFNLKRTLFLSAMASAVALSIGAPNAQAKAMAKATSVTIHAPKGFVKVSDALKNPAMAFIPGLGILYVNPSTLAQGGPFLDYDKQGHLLGATYMIPLSALSAKKDFDNLGGAIAGMKVDHTDIEYSDAHPGVPEPHVHVTNWFVSRSAQVKAVGMYHHMK